MSDKCAVSPVKYMLSGYFGGLCAVGVEHPLEIGIRTFPPNLPMTLTNLHILFGSVFRNLQTEGLKTVFKGTRPLFSIAGTSTAITFFGYGLGRRLVQNKPTDQLSFPGYFLAGAFAGFFKEIAIPLKNEKEFLYLLKRSVQKFDIQETFQITKRIGLKIFNGVPRYPFYKEVVITGIFFMTYDGIRGLMVPEDKRSNICIFRTLIAGGMAGFAFSAANIFADNISSRVTASPGIKGVNSLGGLVKDNGVLSMFRGYTPTMVRSFTSSAACFLGFQICLAAFSWIAPDPI